MLARILGAAVGREFVLSAKASATNAAATVTLAGRQGWKTEITKVVWSYNADPTNGNLSMTGPGVPPDVDVTKGGPGSLSGFGAVVAPDGTAVVVTLAAGGVGVVGKLYVEAVQRPS